MTQDQYKNLIQMIPVETYPNREYDSISWISAGLDVKPFHAGRNTISPRIYTPLPSWVITLPESKELNA